MMDFGAGPLGLLAGAAFSLLLVGACVSDVRWRRIPNRIVAALFLGGIAYAMVTAPPLVALERALGGAGVGLALWLPFWLARVLGAGDVKLAAACGSWLGVAGVVEASLLAALVGGGLALWALSRQGGFAAGAARFGAWMIASRAIGAIVPELTPKERRVPYGVALAAGAAAAAWVPGLLW
ncbi:MAG: A24 family peptidase [Gemmatimonadaceae bacterium]